MGFKQSKTSYTNRKALKIVIPAEINDIYRIQYELYFQKAAFCNSFRYNNWNLYKDVSLQIEEIQTRAKYLKQNLNDGSNLDERYI